MNKQSQRGSVLAWVVILVVLVIVAVIYFQTSTPAEAPAPTTADNSFTTAPAN